jgi:hypothetical protein
MPTILGANTTDPAYEIANSLRFDGSTSYLNRNSIGAGSRRSWTLSMWVKKSKIINNSEMYTWSSNQNAADGSTHDGGGFYGIDSVTGSGKRGNHHYMILSDGDGRIIADSQNRDPSAWSHMVWQIDTENGTENDRLKMFINGSRVVNQHVSQSQVNQNKDVNFNRNGSAMYIGNDQPYTRYYFDGYMAEVAFIDGSSLDASYFGETNAQGTWVPKEFKDDVTFGTNGFYLEFKQTGTSQNSSGIGADTSGNDNHFAVNGVNAKDVCIDTPTNNFITMNPLFTNSRGTFAEGNLMVTTDVQGSVPYGQVEFGGLALNKGKWYYEAKINSVGSGGALGIGWNERAEDGAYINGHNNIGSAGNVVYASGGNLYIGSSHNQSTGVDSFTTNDIIGVALDLDNNKIYFHKNGNYQDDPTPAPASNNGRSIVSSYNNYWTPWMTKDDTNNEATVEFNFGNPTFTVSSSEADDNGYGSFEYDVPAGYYSICTKNIAEFG